ncbi:MAG: AAA family ATPase [Pseudomonadales bacterium]
MKGATPNLSNSSFVIAISGPSGCGKTSLVKAVAERLGDATMLFFDDFPTDPPADGELWATKRDADFSLWATPEFSAALASLKSGNPVTLPDISASVGLDRSRETLPAKFVVVEEPFGRLRPETARSIDFAVFISTPLNVALARRLIRQMSTIERWAKLATNEKERATRLQGATSSFKSFLETYADWMHLSYGEQARQLGESSDLIVDGLRSVDDLATEVVNAVHQLALDES